MSAPEAHFFHDPNLKRLLRQLVQEEGTPVQFDGKDRSGRLTVSSWGWVHHDAHRHVKGWGGEPGCSWVIAEKASVIEESYIQVNDSECEGIDEVGINVTPVQCACGEYQDMHLRYADSLGSVIRYLLSNDGRGISI